MHRDLETKSPGGISEGAEGVEPEQHGRAVMIAQASSTQALSAHVPLVRRMVVASMKAAESKGVTVRRGQGECFNVDTLQNVLDVCLAIHTINKRLQVYMRLCDKQSKQQTTGINYSTGTALKYFVRTRAAKCYKFDSYSLRLIKLNL